MYAGLVKTAQALLAKFGAERTLTRTTQGPFDPLLGTYTSTTVDHKLNGVQVGINDSWRGKFVIEQGDSVFLLAAGVIAPRCQVAHPFSAYRAGDGGFGNCGVLAGISAGR